jgi:hypothetical protein
MGHISFWLMVNPLGDNIYKASKDIRIQVTAEKTKYVHFVVSSPECMPISWIADRSFGNVALFKYLGKAVINKNLVYKEIMRRLNSAILVPIQSKPCAFSSAV